MDKPKALFSRSLLFFKPFWKYIAIVFFMMVIGQAAATFSPFLFGKSVDAVTHNNITLAFKYIGGAFLLAIFQSNVLVWIRERIEIAFLDDHVDKAFSLNSMGKMFAFSIGQHVNEHSGVKQSIVNKGQNALTQLMYNALYNIVPNILQVLVTLVILFFFDWRIAAVASIFLFTYIYISYKRNQGFLPSIQEIRKKNQAQSKLQSELYRNATLVIAEAQENETLSFFKKAADTITDYSTKTWFHYLTVFYSHKTLILFGQYISLGFGVYLIIIGEHSAGMFVTFYAWTNSIFSNLIMIMNSQRQILMQVADIKKFFDLLNITPDIDQNVNGKIIEQFSGEIKFTNVSFAYPYRMNQEEADKAEDLNEVADEEKDEDHAITNVSFTIPPGAKVGFVGQSGSGKSTIVNLLRRYYDPTIGEIFVDNINLKELNLHWFRSQVGNVEQKIELFDRSIKDNILFGMSDNKKVSNEELLQVVHDASLDDFVVKLKGHGLDTLIGEAGIKVSGGERQRIGIARALIKNPKILIFDEATSALDSVNEKLIHEAINRSAEGRTTIIIAHRLSTVMDADIIFVVAEGKIVAQGTHEELQKNSLDYQKLLKNQIVAI
ncbi:ABC transporter ATP-binding protein [Candidatus Nomurabacteria bacterium]|nr:MAG: ABC transporter ATP-binding protein [Candidatus Nomurabacteria bacterium]